MQCSPTCEVINDKGKIVSNQRYIIYNPEIIEVETFDAAQELIKLKKKNPDDTARDATHPYLRNSPLTNWCYVSTVKTIMHWDSCCMKLQVYKTLFRLIFFIK